MIYHEVQMALNDSECTLTDLSKIMEKIVQITARREGATLASCQV